MLLKINCLLIFSLLINFAYSEIATHSLFPEMKGTNPAVISLRQSSTTSIYAKVDKIIDEREIEISEVVLKSIKHHLHYNQQGYR